MSGTEVTGKAYAEWGLGCVDHLLGMFAFAIFEQQTGGLILGRDRLGSSRSITTRPQRLRFASTLPALLVRGGTDTSIDQKALVYYMSFHSVVSAPYTIVSGIRKLPPATLRVVEPDGSHTDHLYWDPAFVMTPIERTGPEQEWQRALLASLRT